MALNRTAFIRGPANITWGTKVYFSQGDIAVTVSKETFDIITSAHGLVDQRLSERMVEISFTPAGEWEDTNFLALFPGASTLAGSSWYGANDTANGFKISPVNTGQQDYTFTNVNITKPPQLILSAVKTLMGPVTFRALNADGSAWSAVASLFAIGAGSPIGNAAFSVSAIKTQPYSAVWTGISGFAPAGGFHSVDGWTINFDLQLTPFTVDAYGTLDMTFDRMVVTANCQPIGMTEAQMYVALGIQGSGAIRGGSLNAGSANLIISSLNESDTGTTFLTLNSVNLISTKPVFGMTANRFGETTWRTTRQFSGATLNPVFAFSGVSA